MSHRESIARAGARTQSSSGPATQETVSVAVLPPRLASGMAPPTGLGVADVFNWDESLNWQHNDPIEEEKNVSKSKSFFRKAGLTTQRKKLNPDLPPFILKDVPYATWRKHYAKDKDGNYKGTSTPAEDCLLKPADVEKWRLGDAVTKADKWTRGREALPVYAEVRENGRLPEYEHDYDGPPQTDPEPYHDTTRGVPDSATLDDDDDALASQLEKRSTRTTSSGTVPEPQSASNQTGSTPSARQPSGQIVGNGKTAQQIIEEAKAKEKVKPSGKMNWRQKLQKGAETAMMGN